MSKSIFIAGALILASLAPLEALPIIYSTGFENPPYTLGPVAGQDGWTMFGGTSATIQNSIVKTGAQALAVSGAFSTQSGPYHSDSSAGPLIEMNVDLMLLSSSSQTSWQFAIAGPGIAPFIGGIDINNVTGSILAITAGFPTVGTFTRNVWHNLDLLLNFTAQKYSITLDGVVLGSNIAFCGDNGPCAGAPVAAMGVEFFDTFGSPNGNDTLIVDNLSVVANPVPEPATIALLGAGLLLIVRRRSSRHN